MKIAICSSLFTFQATNECVVSFVVTGIRIYNSCSSVNAQLTTDSKVASNVNSKDQSLVFAIIFAILIPNIN